MSCPILGCDLPGCHDDLEEGPRRGRWDDDAPDQGPAPLALPPLPEGHPLRRADLVELALDVDCDVEHLRDVVEGRAYLRRELVDITAAALKAQGIKVQASDLDPLGRVYTPEWLADAMAAIVRGSCPDVRYVVDPGCGGGALLRAARRALPSAHLIGVDLDPLAEGFKVADTAVLANALTGVPGEYENLAVLVNPPYDDAGVVILRHMLGLIPGVMVALVPLPWVSLQETKGLVHGDRPGVIIPVVGRPWDRLREAVVVVWGASPADLPRCIERPKGVGAMPTGSLQARAA